MQDVQIIISWSAVSSFIIGVIKKFFPQTIKYATVMNIVLSGLGIFIFYMSQGNEWPKALYMAFNAILGTSGVYNLVGKPAYQSVQIVSKNLTKNV